MPSAVNGPQFSQNVAKFNPGFEGVDEAADGLLQGCSGQAKRREAAPGHRALTTRLSPTLGTTPW